MRPASKNVRTELKVIGGYRVVRLIGKGGMAEVYEVEHERLGVHRALKLFAAEGARADFLRTRFIAEGKLLERLAHPRLVKVHASGVDEVSGAPYLVMDLVLGADGEPQTLATLQTRRQITEERLFGWYEDLTEALRYIHAAGVVHRDVKPSNILIGEDGHAVLSDFGVSRFTDENLRKELAVDATMATDATPLSRVVMGTANYFAPEVRAGATATAAADIYALGVTLFRLLTGVWYEPDTNALELLKSFDPVWRRIFPALLAADPRRRSLPLCRRTRRLWVWVVLAAVIAVVTVCACHFLHSGKVRVVSVSEGVVSVKEGVFSDKEVVAPGKKDIPSEKGGGATERSIESIFFVP